jgi:ribosomal protein L11 methyltransferase
MEEPLPDERAEAEPAERWVRVAVAAGPGTADLAVDALWQAGAVAVEEQDAPDGALRFIGGFADPADADAAVAAATRFGLAAELVPVTDDGLDAWRAWAAPERAGRFWITPAWVEAPALDPGEEVLWIDPGRTFGSGSHPTTRLVLALLDQVVTPGDAVLDVGCGSGVLAVGAARCGAGSALGIDIDPDAPAVTLANAELNGVGDRVTAASTPLAEVAAAGQQFPVVLGNLLAPVIAELAADLVACTAPGGTLIVSGLLDDRWESSMDALAPLEVLDVHTHEGWAAVRLTRGKGQ